MPLIGPSDEALADIADAIRSVAEAITGLAATHAQLIAILAHELRPGMPKPVRLHVTGDNPVLTYSIVLPAPSAADVTKRTLTVNGVPQELSDMTQTEVAGFSGNDNDLVSVILVDTDDAGNDSPERAQTFTLTDTIAPPTPGELGLVVTGETS